MNNKKEIRKKILQLESRIKKLEDSIIDTEENRKAWVQSLVDGFFSANIPETHSLGIKEENRCEK